MYDFLSYCNNISKGTVLIWAFIFLYTVLSIRIRGKSLIDELFASNVFKSSIVSILIIVFCLAAFKPLASALCKDESIEFLPSGVYSYYVEAESDSDNTYTLKATVIKSNDFDTGYAVSKIYFNNGGYLYTELPSEISLYNENDFCDQDGKKWVVKLLNKKATGTQDSRSYDLTSFIPFGLAIYVFYVMVRGIRMKKREKASVTIENQGHYKD